jgi:hypothetical protein
MFAGDNRAEDAAAIPRGFGMFADFVRQDEIADGGAFDGVAITTGTIATNAANGGWARLSGAATTDDSGYQLQGLGSHVCTAGKKIAFKCRQQLGESTSTNSATESDYYLGLFPVDTAIVASVPDNGIYFVKADGGTTITCVVKVATATEFTQTLTAGQFTEDKAVHTFGIGVAPGPAADTSTVTFSIDGVVVARATNISLPASTIYLTPTVAYQSGDNTGTKYVDVDYVGSFQER